MNRQDILISSLLELKIGRIMFDRINLTFWEELAHIAHQHVDKGQRIFVSGRLVADTVEVDDEKQQTYYKVVIYTLF